MPHALHLFPLWPRLLLAVAAWLLPGWLLSRRFGSPAPALTTFLGSAALWFALALVYNACGIPIAGRPVLLGWMGLCAVLAVAAHRIPPPDRSPFPWPRGFDWVWVAAALCGLGSLAVRAWLDPLSGWDNGFRWDFLARSILAHGDLHFYPPVRAADFEAYAWCDGIPPLVPLLNLWIYLAAGSANQALTAVRVIGEAVLLGGVVFGLARSLWGDRGAWAAVGLLGTSSLLVWGVAIGQETGLTAITAVGMLQLLLSRRPEAVSPGWAGIAAGVGALSREYGLAYVLLGIAVLLASARHRRGALLFAGTAIAVAAPWYIRNWLRTGNPVYPQPLAGLFAENRGYADLMQAIAGYWRIDSSHVPLPHVLGSILVLGGVALAAGAVIGARKLGPAAWPAGAMISLIAGVWLWSVPETAGGWHYSLRVLTPAVATAAALSGWIGLLRPGAWRAAAGCAVLGLAADAAHRSWVLPVGALMSPFSWSLDTWREMRAVVGQPQPWRQLVQMAEGGLIAVDSPGLQVGLSRAGGRASMFFSPALWPALDRHQPPAATLGQLRRNGVRLVVLSVTDPISTAFIRAHPFLQALRTRCRPAVTIGGLEVFDLAGLPPLPP